MHDPNFPTTLLEAVKYFSDPETCERFMVEVRWPGGHITCPNCSDDNIARIKSRGLFRCRACQKQFSVKKGTIFEDSALGLDKWLTAVWLITNAKNGISSYEIHRSIGITQKSAWHMLHRIRAAMQQGTFEKMTGNVEADETYIGGKAKNMHKDVRKAKIHGRGRALNNKAIVIGLLERHAEKGKSKVRAVTAKRATKKVLCANVRENVELGANIYSDTLECLEGLHLFRFTLREKTLHLCDLLVPNKIVYAPNGG
jgi:transposase-like protein